MLVNFFVIKESLFIFVAPYILHVCLRSSVLLFKWLCDTVKWPELVYVAHPLVIDVQFSFHFVSRRQCCSEYVCILANFCEC